MDRDLLLTRLEQLKAIREETKRREKNTLRELQLRALNAEILKIARELERLDRVW